jgi:hypothetical protein
VDSAGSPATCQTLAPAEGTIAKPAEAPTAATLQAAERIVERILGSGRLTRQTGLPTPRESGRVGKTRSRRREHGGKLVGVATTFGLAVAFTIHALD